MQYYSQENFKDLYRKVFSTLTKIYSSVFVTNVHFSPKDTDLKDKLDRKKLPKHEYSQNEAWKDFLTSA